MSATTDETIVKRYTARRYRFRRPNVSLTFGLILAVIVVGGGLALLVFGDIDPYKPNLPDRLLTPGTAGYPLGTDELGRDVFSRTISGLRWTVSVGLVSSMIVMIVGTTIGVIAGSQEGILRTIMVRGIDMALAFPYLVLAVTIMAVVGRGFWPMSLTLGIVSWPLVARVVYAETMGLMKRDFILASKLIGDSRIRTIFIHVLPGIKNSLLVIGAFMFADLVIAESGLSFLGIGVPLGESSVGSMLADGREYMAAAPYLLLVPGITIVVMVLAANLIGDGLSARARSVIKGAV